jgi:surfeit locus 1 family protein
MAILVMIRLGIWQLDRLEQRRIQNAKVIAQINQPELILNSVVDFDGLRLMEFRQVTVEGEYDFSQEIVLRNQVWNDQYGVHLLTPLRITGSEKIVFVNRGWIPYGEYQSGNLAKYREIGIVKVTGIIRESQDKSAFGGDNNQTSIPGNRQNAWTLVNLEELSTQLPYDILPVYIQQSPETTWTMLPYRSVPDLDITEGPHLGYALQWFTFAIILAVGYPLYIDKEEKQVRRSELNYEKTKLTLKPSSEKTNDFS